MLLTILSALAPIFGLILVGFGCARHKLLPETAFEVLNRLVISLTLPVLTFRSIAQMAAHDLASPQMIVAVAGGALAVYAVGFALEYARGKDPVRANIAALAACYSNTAFVGLPIAAILLGPGAIGPATLAGTLYAGVVFTTGVLVGELADNAGGARQQALRAAVTAVARSPLILGAVAGIVWALLGLPLAGPADTLLSTLAAATPACALISIGLFMGRANPPAERPVIARIALLKLIIHPLLTLGLVLVLPPMPPLWAKVAVLMAAMPTGTSSFVLAGRAGSWALQTSARAILVTVALAAVTLVPVVWLVLMLPV